MKFSEVPAGAVFRFYGRVFRRLGGNMAEDERGYGAVFLEHTEVECDASPAVPAEPCWVRPPRREARARVRPWGQITSRAAEQHEDSGK